MEYENRTRLLPQKQNLAYLLIISVIGLAINILGVQLAKRLGLPLYLDNIGSALAAALGGYIPGIAVGFLTNLINGIGSVDTVYYGSLTVLIAIFSAFYASRGYYARLKTLPLIILTFALIGGALGSVLTWMLYGLNFGEGISEPLARQLYAGGTLNMFWSQFIADILIDLPDKTITVAVVASVLALLPQRVKQKFAFTGWKQTPVSIRELARSTKVYHRKSLRRKIILLVSMAMIVTAAAGTMISYIN